MDYVNFNLVNPLLTDFYQFSMIYAHWKNGRHNEPSVFDLYYRKNPFGLNFSIFCGVDECFHFLKNFKFTNDHIDYLKKQIPSAEEGFFQYLKDLNLDDIVVYGFENASIVLPNEPLLTIVGPLAKVQLLETTLLNLTNYPTLIATLTGKIRNIYGNDICLIENGSKNCQLSALIGIKYSGVGGVQYTTNLKASEMFGLNLFYDNEYLYNVNNELNEEDFNYNGENVLINFITSNKEIYEKNESFIKNFIYTNLLVDVPYYTYRINNKDDIDIFMSIYKLFKKEVYIISRYIFKEELIVLSNKLLQEDINHRIVINYDIEMLKEKKTDFKTILLGPEFNVSYTQPALGMVYKITEINNQPCIKFSEEKSKQTIPGFKKIIRLFKDDNMIGDYLLMKDEDLPTDIISAYHYNDFNNQVKLTFTKSEVLTKLLYKNNTSYLTKGNIEELVNSYIPEIKGDANVYISERIRQVILKESENINN